MLCDCAGRASSELCEGAISAATEIFPSTVIASGRLVSHQDAGVDDRRPGLVAYGPLQRRPRLRLGEQAKYSRVSSLP